MTSLRMLSRHIGGAKAHLRHIGAFTWRRKASMDDINDIEKCLTDVVYALDEIELMLASIDQNMKALHEQVNKMEGGD